MSFAYFEFPLHRGTRLGWPLSPLLFAISIKPLATALRQSGSFKGITWNGIEHKISLYTDDVLLYVSKPDLSGSNPKLISLTCIKVN